MYPSKIACFDILCPHFVVNECVLQWEVEEARFRKSLEVMAYLGIVPLLNILLVTWLMVTYVLFRALICRDHHLSSQGMSLMYTLERQYGKMGAGGWRRRRWTKEGAGAER